MFRQIHPYVAWLIFAGIAGGYLLLGLYFPVAYVWATYEDLAGEWSQTYFFAAGLVFSALVAIRHGPHRWFFVILAVALFYTVMEEISWGQRVFEFESPDLFKRYNLQRETNLHNLVTGPFSTVTKDIIEYTLAGGLLLYGCVYPLALRLGWGPAQWFHERGLASPPLYLWPFFALSAWLELGPLSFNEAEVAENLVGFALAATAAQYWYAGRSGLNAVPPPAWNLPDSGRMAAVMAAIVVVVLALASGTTWAFYNDTSKRIRIENRLLNGYEKFARRYSRYDRYDVEAELYLKVHEVEPERTSILRRLARAYQNLGDEEMFEHYTRKALDISLEVQRRNPNKISTNLALSRTYRQLGEMQLSREHGNRALELATERALAEPDSAHWAYWLGKVHRQLRDYDAALVQYEKAFRLRPGSTKYRDAYYDMLDATGREKPLGIPN